MARITVEDCREKVANHFELILLATQRARELQAGASPTVPVNRDKATLIALREIAAGTIEPGRLRDALVSRLQMRPTIDDESIDVDDAAADELDMYLRTLSAADADESTVGTAPAPEADSADLSDTLEHDDEEIAGIATEQDHSDLVA